MYRIAETGKGSAEQQPSNGLLDQMARLKNSSRNKALRRRRAARVTLRVTFWEMPVGLYLPAARRRAQHRNNRRRRFGLLIIDMATFGWTQQPALCCTTAQINGATTRARMRPEPSYGQ
jgi:hypothetical protein